MNIWTGGYFKGGFVFRPMRWHRFWISYAQGAKLGVWLARNEMTRAAGMNVFNYQCTSHSPAELRALYIVQPRWPLVGTISCESSVDATSDDLLFMTRESKITQKQLSLSKCQSRDGVFSRDYFQIGTEILGNFFLQNINFATVKFLQIKYFFFFIKPKFIIYHFSKL